MESSALIRWGLILGVPLLCLLLYKLILRVFFGLVIVPEDKIGLVTKKFVLVGRQSLPEGRIIATSGEAGFQLKVLEAIGAQHIRIMPDVLIGGGSENGNGSISGLLGLQLLEQLRKKAKE